eukprot:TRINITY_DN68790_c0_g1_i1.p1 TRINITY_DN68790_c0_g1~~TRINITY_DN68790_c0_g1_i1.p1  ORF type:complete len:324 (-),score=105.13 TRINITY_DN68790_c0_g1_i1:530-1501(-)
MPPSKDAPGSPSASNVKDGVDWRLVDQRLPCRQDVASRRRRKQLFRGMDIDKRGALSLSELQVGMTNVMRVPQEEGQQQRAHGFIVPLPNLTVAVNCAFNCSKDLDANAGGDDGGKTNEEDNTVGPREFHRFLVAFRQFVELAVVFLKADDGDLFLSYKEAEMCIPLLLRWGLDKKSVRAKFPADVTKETMKFNKFAKWCISSSISRLKLTLDDPVSSEDEEEEIRLPEKEDMDAAKTLSMKLFSRLDKDKSGTLTKTELCDIFMELSDMHGHKLSPEDADMLLHAADKTGDGTIDFEELLEWLFNEGTILAAPKAKAFPKAG